MRRDDLFTIVWVPENEQPFGHLSRSWLGHGRGAAALGIDAPAQPPGIVAETLLPMSERQPIALPLFRARRPGPRLSPWRIERLLGDLAEATAAFTLPRYKAAEQGNRLVLTPIGPSADFRLLADRAEHALGRASGGSAAVSVALGGPVAPVIELTSAQSALRLRTIREAFEIQSAPFLATPPVMRCLALVCYPDGAGPGQLLEQVTLRAAPVHHLDAAWPESLAVSGPDLVTELGEPRHPGDFGMLTE
ncbi:MAG: hypothetical protein AAF675_12605 [Pseudomonadota bacterium]